MRISLSRDKIYLAFLLPPLPLSPTSQICVGFFLYNPFFCRIPAEHFRFVARGDFLPPNKSG